LIKSILESITPNFINYFLNVSSEASVNKFLLVYESDESKFSV